MDAIFGIYGLRLGTNHSIPGLPICAGESRIDVRIELGSMPEAVTRVIPAKHGERTHQIVDEYARPEAISWRSDNGRGFRLRYEDGTEFVVDDYGTRIWAVWPATLTLEDTAVYLLGPVLAFVLRLRGITCLHASAFTIGTRTVALLGPSGAGKSTTAAAFAIRGVPVLSDDLLAIEKRHGTIVVHPGGPRLRLWPDSLDILPGISGKLPRLTPNWDKRYLDLTCDRYRLEQRPRSLSAIYLLDGRGADSATPLIESLSASGALLNLLANARGDFHPSKESRRREFDMLARVARAIPVRRITGSSGPDSLVRLCDAIVEDLASMSDDAELIAN